MAETYSNTKDHNRAFGKDEEERVFLYFKNLLYELLGVKLKRSSLYENKVYKYDCLDNQKIPYKHDIKVSPNYRNISIPIDNYLDPNNESTHYLCYTHINDRYYTIAKKDIKEFINAKIQESQKMKRSFVIIPQSILESYNLIPKYFNMKKEKSLSLFKNL